MRKGTLPGQRVALIYFAPSPSESLEEICSLRDALRSLGYDVIRAPFKGRLREFVDIFEFNRPHLALNLCRPHPSYVGAEMTIPGVLDLLGVPYTGPSPSALSLAQHHERAFDHLAAHSIPLCRKAPPLQHIESIGLVGNGPPRILPSNGSSNTLRDLALRAYTLLGLRDCALLQFKNGGSSPPRLSGIAPLPDLSPRSALAHCAETGGLPYSALIHEIVTLALSRVGR